MERLSALLGEADFEEAGCRWEAGGGLFTLSTSRPSGEDAKPAGLLRKGGREWARCRLTFRGVREFVIRHEWDAKPSEAGLLEVKREGQGARVRLSSSRGLVVELTLDRISAELEE